MQKDNLLYLHHISECIEKVFQYTKGFNQENFLSDSMVQDAVIRNFEIIGEATKQLSGDFRNQYSEIEWKKIAGLRDKLIHDYMGVDLEAIWSVIENILPDLNIKVREIISNQSPKT